MPEPEECCPICGRSNWESRSIVIDCFYAVDEIVPQVKKQKSYRKIPNTGIYVGGTTVRYSGGQVEGFEHTHSTESKFGSPVHHWKSTITPMEPGNDEIRLLEHDIFVLEGCKSCRSDFLHMLKRFANGEFISSDGAGNIPVRVAGAVKMFTEEDYKKLKAERREEKDQ